MYRGVAVACLDGRVEHDDAEAVADVCRRLDIAITTDPDDLRLHVAGADVTARIREPDVTAWVSAVSTNAACRADLVRRQRAIIGAGDIVVEGRDITTVVAPDADVRVLLVADPVARMSRRGKEMAGRLDEAGLRDQVLRRDKDDSRLVNFTEAAPGVTLIDSSFLTIDETVDRIVALVPADSPE
jgi:cytidylate kinase